MKDRSGDEHKYGKQFFKTLSQTIGLDIDMSADKNLPQNGLYARFHPAGELAAFGYRKDGNTVGWSLEVGPDGQTSRCFRNQIYDFPKDAWTHPEEGTRENADDWLKRWVEDICEDVGSTMRCSFCGKDSENATLMMSGKNDTYICDECVLIMADIVEERMGGKGPENNA